MSPDVKKHCIEYFQNIGGIESVKPEYRVNLKRSVITLYTELEENGILSKMKMMFNLPPKEQMVDNYILHGVRKRLTDNLKRDI